MFSVEQQLDNVSSMAVCQQYCQSASAFNCRAYHYDESSKGCFLSADDRISVKSAINEVVQGQQQLMGFMERSECIDSKSLSCF